MSARALPASVDRYELLCELASGGMGTVYIARRGGPEGFQRLVAVKLCHRELAEDPDFVSMFIDEARLAASIHHAHVVSTIDAGLAVDTLFLAMEYVEGASLAALMTAAHRAGQRLPRPVALRVVADLLAGLAAAHAAEDAHGQPLGIIHRDVSPQNVLVGADGLSRLLDFGVAKAVERRSITRAGHTKGKAAYMAPEQLRSEALTQRIDVYAAGVVLWECLTGERLFAGRGGSREVVAPSQRVPELSPALDAVVLRALEARPEDRYGSALEMLQALEAVELAARPREVAAALEGYLGSTLAERRQRVREALRERGAIAAAAEDVPVDVTPSLASARPADETRMLSAAEDAPPAKPTLSPRRTRAPRARRVGAALASVVFGCVAYVVWSTAGAPPGSRRAEASTAPAVARATPPPARIAEAAGSTASAPLARGALLTSTAAAGSSSPDASPPAATIAPGPAPSPTVSPRARRKFVPSAI